MGLAVTSVAISSGGFFLVFFSGFLIFLRNLVMFKCQRGEVEEICKIIFNASFH